MINSANGREVLEKLRGGELDLLADLGEDVQLQSERPPIFVLYEQNIGLLTPMIAEELRDAEKTYPADWIADAFREAVELNKRSWRYVLRILERWRHEGRGSGTDAGRLQDDAEAASAITHRKATTGWSSIDRIRQGSGARKQPSVPCALTPDPWQRGLSWAREHIIPTSAQRVAHIPDHLGHPVGLGVRLGDDAVCHEHLADANALPAARPEAAACRRAGGDQPGLCDPRGVRRTARRRLGRPSRP